MKPLTEEEAKKRAERYRRRGLRLDAAMKREVERLHRIIYGPAGKKP